MDLKQEELERIHAIQRLMEEESEVEIYRSVNRSKKWFTKWKKRYHTGQEEWYKDLRRGPKRGIHNRTSKKTEQVVINIRKSLMDGSEESARYSFVGADAVRFRMAELGYNPSEIPSLSTIKRIIKNNKLRVNKKERYKRVSSKGRYTILKPECIDEMHQIDFVGPRYIKGFGAVNSLHLKDVVGRQAAGNQYSGKSMNNVIEFLLNYWKSHPIPKYLQTDNSMAFVGDYTHPRSISRFVRLCLFVGIEVVFIAPAKPWMNGTIEEFNKGFERLFWSRETFTDLSDIQAKSEIFFVNHNKYNQRKLEKKDLKSVTPKRMLRRDSNIDINNLPLVAGKIHFIRIVDGQGDVIVLNERFHVGEEYIGEYIWVTIDTRNRSLIIVYNDEKMVVRKINQFDYKLDETVVDLEKRIFVDTDSEKEPNC